MARGIVNEINNLAVDRFYAKFDVTPGCWNWTASVNSRYGKLKVNGQTISAHRFSYEHYIGPIPDGLLVCHHCDNPKCVNPNHFFLGTHADNIADRDAKDRGSAGIGENNGSAKLTADDVRAIRLSARPQRHIAKQFGISQQQVGRIKLRQLWRSVE